MRGNPFCAYSSYCSIKVSCLIYGAIPATYFCWKFGKLSNDVIPVFYLQPWYIKMVATKTGQSLRDSEWVEESQWTTNKAKKNWKLEMMKYCIGAIAQA